MVGGISNAPGEPGFGIFIKKVLHGGRAYEDGEIIFTVVGRGRYESLEVQFCYMKFHTELHR